MQFEKERADSRNVMSAVHKCEGSFCQTAAVSDFNCARAEKGSPPRREADRDSWGHFMEKEYYLAEMNTKRFGESWLKSYAR